MDDSFLLLSWHSQTVLRQYKFNQLALLNSSSNQNFDLFTVNDYLIIWSHNKRLAQQNSCPALAAEKPRTSDVRHAWWKTQIDTCKRNKTYSFWNPETLIPESDELDTSPQTTSNYDLEASSRSQTLLNPDTTPHQTSSRLPNMSSANQTTASAQIISFSSSIYSASSATPTASTHIKKKFKTPTPFSGKREDLQKFLQEIKIYLLANGNAYPTDLDKVLFVLSYMSNGDANSWKEEFFDSAEQKAAQKNSPLSLGTYQELTDLIVKDFSPYNAPKDAIYEMKELKMGNTTIEEHVASVATALAGVFAISVNKICKIMEIFE